MCESRRNDQLGLLPPNARVSFLEGGVNVALTVFPNASTVHYYIYEFSVDGTTTTPNPPFLKTIPSTNSHLAAVTFNGQGDRFIMYANTDGTADNNGIYYVNSSDLERK